MTTCTWNPGDATAAGDTLYGPRACDDTFIGWAWEAFDFDKEDWDDGWGYDNPCDVNGALSRTLSAIWCLTYSAGLSPSATISSAISILNWGWKYAQHHIDELDARCPVPGAVAMTQWGALADDWTELYPAFFDSGVPLRAAVLLHESCHAAGTSHDSGNNDSTWAYNGPYRWQVAWLARFWSEAQFSTQPLRDMARAEANLRLRQNFATNPGFVI
jgi:hypothetical protein